LSQPAIIRVSVELNVFNAGIGGVFCRHGILQLALNLFTGEKWAYVSLLICTMLLNYGVCPEFFWCAPALRALL